ncbi:tail fiber protein [Ahrensia sp. R2A130]|uniref:tail fiber protein n=1 Tax=Ahrensia sp. R2A130 TaxID=744979 RepID=UPI0001E0D8AB|nr:tail fiber protein [Ahrensia sp. R2A130]EFL87715.1 Na-Ca exchanger/integrin-beta4 [Ahrensia sp. R2A130]
MTIDNRQNTTALEINITTQGIFPSRGGTSSTAGDSNGYLSEIRFFGQTDGFFDASTDGQLLSIASNSALFSLLGTNFGGDGRTTFGLPDLGDKLLIGKSSSQPGALAGSDTTQLTTANVPVADGGGGQTFSTAEESVEIMWVIDTQSDGTGFPAGTMRAFATNFAPRGFLEADGRTLQISDHPELFSAIGNTFGGDGLTTFQLPNMEGRTPYGADGTAPLGTQGGSSEQTLTTSLIPVTSGGDGNSYDDRDPFVALTPIVVTQGLFPSRDFSPAQGTVLGEVVWIAGSTIPQGFALADGSLLPIAQNSALFSLLGTQYGGDGRTTFGLPDLTGASMVGNDTDRRNGSIVDDNNETLENSDLPVAISNDDFAVVEAAGDLTGNLFAANGPGRTIDIATGRTIIEVPSASVGTEITLFSGALLTVNADGTFLYKQNGAFSALADAASGTSGDTSAADVFSYRLNGGAGANVVIRITGVDSEGDELFGTANRDVLNGGIGADTMTAGDGDDVYSVDNTGDTVVEVAAQGHDVVYASASYSLPVNVETLILTGGDDINGTGNAESNFLFGNAGSNRLDGGGGADGMSGSGGNDIYVVDNVNDAISENAGEGDDTVESSVDWSLGADFEKLTLTGSDNIYAVGNGLANTITGNSGNNYIDGGTGTDIMRGGAGDDTYVVDNSADVVTELNGDGADRVLASIDYILGDFVETLVLTGTATIGVGNSGDNSLIGNEAINVLSGKQGTDYLVGNGGDDIFVIDRETDASDFDVIADFQGAGVAGGDRLGFSAADFGADGIVTQLSQTSFIVSRIDGSGEQQFILADLAPGNSGLIEDDYYFG